MLKQELLNKVLLNNAVRNNYIGTARILLLSGTLADEKEINIKYLLKTARTDEMRNLLRKYSSKT